MHKYFLQLTIGAVLAGAVGCQSGEGDNIPQGSSVTATAANGTVEAGCAMCIFGVEGREDCELAVKIDGKPYLVTGIDVDTHGSGFCDSSKQAVVEGEVKDGKFVATKFEFK